MKLQEIIKAGWESNKDFYKKLKDKKALTEFAFKNDITKLYHDVHHSKPVFVLSTGRCGTAFLTNLLQIDNSLRVYHEPYPEFTFHSEYAYKNYLENPEAVKMMFDVARYELMRESFISNKQYVETNNRITFFAFQIAELFPNAKFIHLVRNPISFVKSGLSRSWYSGNSLYDEGRITKEDENWSSFSDVEKIAWLWNETNMFIEKFKSKQKNVLFIKAEDLFQSIELQSELFKFINEKSPDKSKISNVAKRKINEGKKVDLSNEQHNSIKIAIEGNELMLRYGYSLNY